jgi:hypothetical protein
VRDRLTLAAAAGLLVLFAALGIFLQGSSAAGSALSRNARGALALRRLVEAYGVSTTVLREPALRGGDSGALVVLFPWQSALPVDDGLPLLQHVRDGGALVLGYTGQAHSVMEARVLDDLFHLELERARPEPPLAPWEWRRYSRETWTLHPDSAELPGLAEARVSALSEIPRPPVGARVLYRNESDRTVVFSYSYGRGQVFVMPSEMLANGRLSEAGNADWAVTLARALPRRWTFDEYHHGLTAEAAPEAGVVHTEHFMDLYLGQLVFLYLMALLALGRRFGPAWREPRVVSGSVARFLVGLGGLHARLGHHDEAAAVLVQRAQELDKRTRVSAEALEHGRIGADEFLALAQATGGAHGRTRG